MYSRVAAFALAFSSCLLFRETNRKREVGRCLERSMFKRAGGCEGGKDWTYELIFTWVGCCSTMVSNTNHSTSCSQDRECRDDRKGLCGVAGGLSCRGSASQSSLVDTIGFDWVATPLCRYCSYNLQTRDSSLESLQCRWLNRVTIEYSKKRCAPWINMEISRYTEI